MRGIDVSLRKDALSPLWTLKIEMGDAIHIFALDKIDLRLKRVEKMLFQGQANSGT